jgi:hypothetical protein
MPQPIIPPVPVTESSDLQAKGGSSGDGGNRTHATFPSSADTQLREATLPDGTSLTYSVDDGCHLLTTEGGTVDLTDWIDQPGLLPADGVESVRDQFASRATAASRERA